MRPFVRLKQTFGLDYGAGHAPQGCFAKTLRQHGGTRAGLLVYIPHLRPHLIERLDEGLAARLRLRALRRFYERS